MSKLYELAHDLELAIAATIDPDTGEILSEVMNEQLDKIEMEFEHKALSVACAIKNLEADQEALKAESAKLVARAKSKATQAEGLKAYLVYYLPDKPTMEDSRAKISWRNSTTVVVDRVDLLPSSCVRSKPDEPDKAFIKAELVAGHPIVGARLIENRRLQIK